MEAKTKLTSKGQVVIPKAVRDRLRWLPGTVLRVGHLPEGGIRLSIDTEEPDGDPLEQLHGCVKGHDLLGDLEAEHGNEVEQDARRRRA